MCRSAAREAPWDRGGWPAAGGVLPTAPGMRPKPLGTSQSPSQAAAVRGQAPGSPPASGWGQGQGCAVLSREELWMCGTQSCPRLPRVAWIKQEKRPGVPARARAAAGTQVGAQRLLTNWDPASTSHPPCKPHSDSCATSCCQTLCHAPFLSLGGGRRIGQNLPLHSLGRDWGWRWGAEEVTDRGAGEVTSQRAGSGSCMVTFGARASPGLTLMYPQGDSARPGGSGPPPSSSNTAEIPWLLLPLPAWLLARGPGVPTGLHALGQAALSISAGRQTAVTGDRHNPPVT